jgi:peptidoglycan/xylan/chitin deacetylase (PgdA/CDA1 family)
MNSAIVLMYHNVGNPPAGKDPLGLYVSPGMFRFQMWYLKTAGLKVVPLEDIADFIHGRSNHKRIVSLTFDDGYQDFYDNAYPVLRAYNFPSTVFVISDLIGKENTWDSGGVTQRKKLMDWDIIRRLTEDGVTFGSHTKTHPFLSRLSPDTLRTEIFGSKSLLEAKLQLAVDLFCYPYGDYDPRAIDMVREAGYRLAVTTKRGLVHEGDDPFQVRRSFIRSQTNPFLFFLRLHSGYEDRKRGE